MKAINSSQLLESLKVDVRAVIVQASKLESYGDKLTKQPETGSWSIAQVLEHLNIYSRFYINAIEAALHLHRTTAREMFNPGVLGNYFTKVMEPANGMVSKKMKAPKLAVPAIQPDATAMLREFLQHQHHLLNLLQVAQTADLETIRIQTFLSRFISLKLGDMFRFLIAHEQRHFVQIGNVSSRIGAS